MKIILSPAKNMKYILNKDNLSKPCYLSNAKELVKYLKSLNDKELNKIYKVNPKILKTSKEYLNDFSTKDRLTPALLAFDGIAFTYLESEYLSNDDIEYLNDHLYILSALYGVLKPWDAISKYRLEMGSSINFNNITSLYDYWGNKIYKKVFETKDIVLNLASKEYSLAVSKYLNKEDRFIDVYFYELDKDKLVEKGVYCKMARGRLVRYIAKNKIDNIEDVKKWNELNYCFDEKSSNDHKIVFIRKNKSID